MVGHFEAVAREALYDRRAQRKPFELKLIAGHLVGREQIGEGRGACLSGREHDR
jgi:hypothetical protein